MDFNSWSPPTLPIVHGRLSARGARRESASSRSWSGGETDTHVEPAPPRSPPPPPDGSHPLMARLLSHPGPDTLAARRACPSMGGDAAQLRERVLALPTAPNGDGIHVTRPRCDRRTQIANGLNKTYAASQLILSRTLHSVTHTPPRVKGPNASMLTQTVVAIDLTQIPRPVRP